MYVFNMRDKLDVGLLHTREKKCLKFASLGMDIEIKLQSRFIDRKLYLIVQGFSNCNAKPV